MCLAPVVKGRCELVVRMILFHILVVVAFLPMLATAEIRLQSGGWWKVSTDATTCSLEFYLRDHPHDVPDHGVNFMISVLNFSKPPKIVGRTLDDDVAPILSDLLLVKAWPSLVSTPLTRLFFQDQKEPMRPVQEEQIADTTRSFFVFSTKDTARFIEAILFEREVTIHWAHEDGHSDVRVIGGTDFAAKRELFETCKAQIAK